MSVPQERNLPPPVPEGADLESVDPEEVNTHLKLGDAKEKVEDEEKRKRRKRCFLWILLLLLLLLLIFMIVFFTTRGGGSTVLAVTQTDAPTKSPVAIDELTPAPVGSIETEGPTSTPNPTPSPTFDTGILLSARSCTEIVEDESLHLDPGVPFRSLFDLPGDREVCGDTYAGFPRSPDRNPWTPNVGEKECFEYDFDAGTEICEEVGARRCTADELQFGAAQGTGCDGDNRLLYSSTACETEDSEAGIFLVNFALKQGSEVFFECESDLSRETVLRCCADT